MFDTSTVIADMRRGREMQRGLRPASGDGVLAVSNRPHRGGRHLATKNRNAPVGGISVDNEHC
jgi:hypothetical protein